MKKLLSEKINTQIYTLGFIPLFFIACFLYVWLIINPVLYYQQQQPLFYFGGDFFSEYLTYPGGIVEYVSAFLSQLYFYPWLGALVITLIAWLISVNTGWIVKEVSESKQVRFLNLVPVILLLALHNKYEHPLSIGAGLLFTLSAYNLFYKTAPKSILRLLYYLLFAVILYYAAAGLFFLFVLMCLLHEVFINKRNDLGFFYLVIAGAIPFLAANYVFILSLQEAYTDALKTNVNYVPVYTPYYYYFYFPAVFLLIYLYNRVVSLKTKKTFSNLFFAKGNIKLAAIAIVLFAGGWLILNKTLDSYNKKFLQIQNYAYSNEWEKLIEQVDPEMLNNKMVAFQLNRALFHTGRLAGEMFMYPQFAGVEALILPHEISQAYPLDKCDILYELGHITEAQHWAFEAFAQTGYSPWNLQRLTLISLIKGNDQVVIKCLNMLNKSLLFKGWAEKYREYLFDKSLIEKDKDLQKIRSRAANSDFIVNPDNPNFDLEAMLKANKNNKMAFEYLMAYFLLNRKIKPFVKYMDYLPLYGYKSIPRHYEEAILAYLSIVAKDNNNQIMNNIDFNTRKEFTDLMSIMKRYHNDKSAAYNEVASRFGSTYWTYLLYN